MSEDDNNNNNNNIEQLDEISKKTLGSYVKKASVEKKQSQRQSLRAVLGPISMTNRDRSEANELEDRIGIGWKDGAKTEDKKTNQGRKRTRGNNG